MSNNEVINENSFSESPRPVESTVVNQNSNEEIPEHEQPLYSIKRNSNRHILERDEQNESESNIKNGNSKKNSSNKKFLKNKLPGEKETGKFYMYPEPPNMKKLLPGQVPKPKEPEEIDQIIKPSDKSIEKDHNITSNKNLDSLRINPLFKNDGKEFYGLDENIETPTYSKASTKLFNPNSSISDKDNSLPEMGSFPHLNGAKRDMEAEPLSRNNSDRIIDRISDRFADRYSDQEN